MSELLTAAQQYINQGWHIIPLRPGKKTPYVADVKEYRQRFPTTDELTTWFERKDCNIGILTGQASGLLVVDIDPVDDRWQERVAEWQERFPCEMVATTPRGGMHFYYAYDGTDITISASKLDKGVDIRGEGGYIVAAPSVYVFDDEKYHDTPYQGQRKSYGWVQRKSLTPLPADLKKTLQVQQTMAQVVADTAQDGHELLIQILSNGFTSGQHNTQTKDLARYLYRMGMNYSAILNMLTTLNQKDATPLPQSELEATIRSGLKYEQSRAKEEATPAFTVEQVADVLAEYWNYDVDYLVDEWIPENSVLIVSAPPENYKTWLLLDAAITVALGSGEGFLGTYACTEPVGKPVIIIQQEDFIGQVAQRIRTILQQKAKDMQWDFKVEHTDDDTIYTFDSPYNAPIYLHTESLLAFDNPDSMAGLRRVIQETGAKLVVIDPLYMLDKADDYFASLARKMQMIKQIRKEYGVSFIFAHHNRKSGGEGRQQIYGSVLLDGSFEGAWVISSVNGRRMIERRGKFYKSPLKLYIDFKINTTVGQELYEVTTEPYGEIKLDGKFDQAVYDFVEDNPMCTQTEVGNDVGCGRKVARDVLIKLVNMGVISENNKKYFIPTMF